MIRGATETKSGPVENALILITMFYVVHHDIRTKLQTSLAITLYAAFPRANVCVCVCALMFRGFTNFIHFIRTM